MINVPATGKSAPAEEALTPETPATKEAQQHSEGIVARTIEHQTAKLPSDIFLWAALGSIGISLYFELKGETQKSSFVSRWVSPFLLLGVYNKLVKIAGSDRIQTDNQL